MHWGVLWPGNDHQGGGPSRTLGCHRIIAGCAREDHQSTIKGAAHASRGPTAPLAHSTAPSGQAPHTPQHHVPHIRKGPKPSLPPLLLSLFIHGLSHTSILLLLLHTPVGFHPPWARPWGHRTARRGRRCRAHKLHPGHHSAAAWRAAWVAGTRGATGKGESHTTPSTRCGRKRGVARITPSQSQSTGRATKSATRESVAACQGPARDGATSRSWGAGAPPWPPAQHGTDTYGVLSLSLCLAIKKGGRALRRKRDGSRSVVSPGNSGQRAGWFSGARREPAKCRGGAERGRSAPQHWWCCAACKKRGGRVRARAGEEKD